MNNLRDAVASAGAKVARAKLNLSMAEAELAEAMQKAIAAPKPARPRTAQRPASYAVKLISTGQNRIGAIKVTRQFAGLGLKEAKDLVETCVPFGFSPTILDNVSLELAQSCVKEFQGIGGVAEIGRSFKRS